MWKCPSLGELQEALIISLQHTPVSNRSEKDPHRRYGLLLPLFSRGGQDYRDRWDSIVDPPIACSNDRIGSQRSLKPPYTA
jgi:hypothetical protein